MSTHADGGAPKTTPTNNATGAQVADNVSELWQRFDERAERNVRELVESLSQQLDNLLLFAGLFSAINTALLIYTLPTLSPSPQNQTNALLYLLVQGLNNSTLSALGDAAATNSSPTTSDVRVNALFTASLTCSSVASFGAVVGKQWLAYYSRSAYSNPEERRRELQRKIMGADQYYLRGILEGGLSSLLQVALLLFTVGLVIFLQTIDQTIALINTAITAVGLAALVSSLLIALWDDGCPYQSFLTISIIPSFIRFMMWLVSVAFWLGPVLVMGALSLPVAGWLAAKGRLPVAQAQLIGMWCFFWEYFGISGFISRVAAGTYEKTAQSLKRDVTDNELYAASMAWLVIHTRDKAEFNSVVEAVPIINEREQLNFFAHSHAINRFFRSEQYEGTTHPQLAPFMTPAAHVYVATVDVASEWFITMARRLMRHQPVGGSLEEYTEPDRSLRSKLPVPAPLYIAAALRSILDHRIYFKWKRNPGHRNKAMDERGAKLRLVIMSCANPSTPSRVVSMIALALKITTERKSRPVPPPREVHRSQKADYEAIWSSYMSDEPFVKNLAGAILVYAEHGKTPPENAVWPSEAQFTDLLLASHPYIETGASAKQLELDGLDLIRGCVNLLGSLTGPGGEVLDEKMVEAAGKLIGKTIKRAVASGDPSTEMLKTEVKMLKALSQLYHDHHYAPIPDSFYRLMEHCQAHLTENPADDPSALVSKVTNSTGHIVEFTQIDREGEGMSATRAPNPTMAARYQNMKRRFDQLVAEAGQRRLGIAYAPADDPHLVRLAEEQTKKELREALKPLQELANLGKASPAGEEAEIMPQTVLTSLE